MFQTKTVDVMCIYFSKYTSLTLCQSTIIYSFVQFYFTFVSFSELLKLKYPKTLLFSQLPQFKCCYTLCSMLPISYGLYSEYLKKNFLDSVLNNYLEHFLQGESAKRVIFIFNHIG